MAVADHGGFDIVTECTFAALNAGLATTPFGKSSGALHQPLRIGPLVCDIVVNPGITALMPVLPVNHVTPLVDSTVTDATAFIEVSALDFGTGNPQPIAVQQIPMPVTLTVRTSLDVVGLGAGIFFNPPGAVPATVVGLSLDTTELFKAAIIQQLYVYTWFIGGPAAVENLDKSLVPYLRDAIRDAELAALEFFPGFFVLALQRLVPGGPLFTAGAPAPTALAIDLTPTAIRLLITLAGTAGTPALITRSALRPGDVSSILVSNKCLLRDCVRSRVATAFGIPLAAFSATNPWFVPGPVSAAPPGLRAGITMMISNLQIGIDEMGFLQVHFDFTVPAGFATSIDGTFMQQLLPTARTVGGRSPITSFAFATSAPLATIPKPVVSTHISHPWWFYLGLGILFTPLSPALQALQDAINGAINSPDPAAAPLAKAFGGSSTAIRVPTTVLSVLVPGGSIPIVTAGALSVFQPTAVAVPLPGVTPLFRDHDLVINIT